MSEKKKLIIEIILFILLLTVITISYRFFINQNTEQAMQENSLKNSEGEEKVEIVEIKSMEQFEQEVKKEEGIVLIDFYATWCMPCKAMSPILEEIAKEYEEVKVVKVDVDKNEELAIQHNVMSIPTILIMKNGEVIKTFVGITSKENIIKEF